LARTSLAAPSTTKTADTGQHAADHHGLIAPLVSATARPAHPDAHPRRGEPMSVDSFANPSGNQNGVVVGVSGSASQIRTS
jgi:hypothetical protein